MNDHQVSGFLGFHFLLVRDILESAAIFTVTLCPPRVMEGEGGGAGLRGGALSP